MKWLAFLLLLPSIAFGADFYATNADSDCNPASPGAGTIGDPFTNPHYALYQGGVGCGDTLYLRGGTYQNTYPDAFLNDTGLAARADSCDDDTSDGDNPDGSHTVLPMITDCTAGNELVVTNFAGEVVILEGTDAGYAAGGVWTQCESSSQCGSATGLNLPDSSESYYSEAFNYGSAGFLQLWVNPANALDPGSRLRYVSETNASQLVDGTFAYLNVGSRVTIINLHSGISPADPDSHTIKVGGRQGNTAGNVVTLDGEHNILRKNPAGGSFIIRYGNYGVHVDKNGNNNTVDGVDFIAMGSRDGGGCVRAVDGDFITFQNGTCIESMSHGMYMYGGGPQDGNQTSNNSVINYIIKNLGRAWIDGGGVGNNLGTGIIIKNCENCSAIGNFIEYTYRNGIQVNYSEDTCDGAGPCSSDGYFISRNRIKNTCHFELNGDINAGTSDCAAINVVADPGNNGSANSGIIENNMVTGEYFPAFSNSPTPIGIQIDANGATGNALGSIIRNNSVNGVAGACISIGPTPDPTIVSNNIMSNCGPCGGSDECALHISDTNDGHTIDSNNYFPNGVANCPIRRDEPNQCVTVANLGTVDANFFALDPLFVSSTDLHLQSSSIMINTGGSISPTSIDFDGQSRPQGGVIDIGAHEFLAQSGALDFIGALKFMGNLKIETN